MIVICPACHTGYMVSDTPPGADEERSLRCPSCLHLWHYSPEGAAIQAALAEVVAAVDVAAKNSAAPSLGIGASPAHVGPSLSYDPAEAKTLGVPSGSTMRSTEGSRRGVMVSVLGAIIIAVIAVITIADRGTITATWPAAGPTLAKLHLAELPGQGLEISSVLTHTTDSVVIAGDIVNKTAVPQRVPRLQLTLRSADQSDLESKVIDPPSDRLLPGATVHFTAEFEHPSITTTGIAVAFVAD